MLTMCLHIPQRNVEHWTVQDAEKFHSTLLPKLIAGIHDGIWAVCLTV
jgi:hypothetical protein